jgi:hypothetical protein
MNFSSYESRGGISHEHRVAGGRRRATRQLSARDSANRGARVDEMETFRCTRCGEVIGVYEPLVVRTELGARSTSRAAEPEMKAAGATHFHRACYAAIGAAA